MSITVTAVQARQSLEELLDRVSTRHEEILIERAGKKIARLTAMEEEVHTVNEPITEEYTVQKKSGSKINLSSLSGTWNDEERQKFAEAANSLGASEEFRQARRIKTLLPVLEDIPEGVIPDRPDILDLYGLGKEMWESTGLTPDEYVQKEREEWD